MKNKTKRISLLALMVALTTIFCFVPVHVGTVSLALMILPLLVIANVEDFKMTISLAIWLAVINQIAWYTTKAGSPLAVAFQDPMVCMLPRILIGVVVWCVNRGLKKLILKPTLAKAAAISLEQVIIVVSTALGVVTNTAFVALFTLLFHTGAEVGTSGVVIDAQYLLAWFGINFAIEVVAFALITPPIVFALVKSGFVGEKVKKEDLIKEENEVVKEA